MSARIADIEIPDSALTKAATDLVGQAASPLLFDHSRRVFLFGSLAGIRQGLAYDPELLYVGAMFHDLGLTETYRTTDQRFELDSADEARRFLKEHSVPEDSARIAWEAIALHTTPGVPHRMAPEIALVTTGVEADVLGIGLEEIPAEARAEIVAAHPAVSTSSVICRQGPRPASPDGTVRAHRPGTRHAPCAADRTPRRCQRFGC
jgi:hypothetical protein